MHPALAPPRKMLYPAHPDHFGSSRDRGWMSQDLSPDTTLSHYRVVSKLEAGGMGEVYLVEDIKLDHKVALKLLPAQFTQDGDRVRRFVQEAKAASALNHPHILTLERGEPNGYSP
jgi:serine/threonine protein kinase